MALKQQKTAAQVLVAIKKRCETGVLDHTTLILNAPGASTRTKLISFVRFIEGRRLCDLSVVTVVQDDIRSLDPINTFADAVDNMIAINLLQEELLMMGQPYSDADLIIQHSNKTNSENFRALKMEFIDCDVSQFSTARPSLTHNQPNPQHLHLQDMGRVLSSYPALQRQRPHESTQVRSIRQDAHLRTGVRSQGASCR